MLTPPAKRSSRQEVLRPPIACAKHGCLLEMTRMLETSRIEQRRTFTDAVSSSG